jgi:hypothetical protein
MVLNNLITWKDISNITTLSTLVVLMVQFTKPYVPISTQLWAYCVATLVLISSDILKKDFKNIPMSLFNGFIVASLSSNTVALMDRI